ncbi:MAG: hypothetical protein RRZ64_05835 [Rikenellaceae bacterium]
MINFLYKITMLVIVALVQVYLFDRLPSLPHLHFSFYLTFVLLLSIKTPPMMVMLLSSLLGVVIDLLTGTGGLITIAITSAAYLRILLLKHMVSEDSIGYDFTPSIATIGGGRWAFYCITIVAVNGLLLVVCESGGLVFINTQVFIRLLLNIALTTVILYITQFLINHRPKSSY